MRCLITGASGHLGSFLTRLLLTRGHKVLALARPPSDFWRLDDVLRDIHVLRAEPAEWASCRGEVIRFAPETVFHLGWAGVTANARNDQALMTENVAQSLALFRLTEASGCRTWVGIGSQAEYGPQARPLTEDMPTRPVTAYGAAKLRVGTTLGTSCERAGMRLVWVRLLATYGPKDDARHLIPSVTLQLLARRRPALTRGEQRWDYLYVADAAEALLAVAECERAAGVYNLGSGEAVAVRRIVEKLRDLIDPSLPLGLGELPYREDQLMLLQADIGKLRAATGWTPTTALDDGLGKTAEWYRRNGGTGE